MYDDINVCMCVYVWINVFIYTYIHVCMYYMYESIINWIYALCHMLNM